MPHFTIDELNSIEAEALANQDYRIENEIRFGRNKSSILRVSPVTGLILVHGNENTGYTHILNRHTDPRNFTTWLMNEQNQQSSKFIIKKWWDLDFMTIADDVYKQINGKQNNNNNYEK